MTTYTTIPRITANSTDFDAIKTIASENAQETNIEIGVFAIRKIGYTKIILPAALAHTNGTITEY